MGPVGAPRGEPVDGARFGVSVYFIDLSRVSKTRPKRNAVDIMAGPSGSTGTQTLGLTGDATGKTHRPAISCPLVSLTEKDRAQATECPQLNSDKAMCFQLLRNDNQT